MSITIDDLEEQIGSLGPHPILYCERCGAENSANKADYFRAMATLTRHPFMCCQEPMRLVYKIVTYVDVSSVKQDKKDAEAIRAAKPSIISGIVRELEEMTGVCSRCNGINHQHSSKCPNKEKHG